jgi:ATP-dependent protease HslVU (ClpYQ) peptidase subunit
VTTIFACEKAGVMVTDSRCTSDGIWLPMTKVHRVGQELVGIAGNVKDGLAWLKWYRGGAKGARPKLESFSALVLRNDGLYSFESDGLEMKVERGFHGIGSGGACAIAAFMAGVDAERAVHIACAIDTASGGDVIVHRLKP